MNGANGKKRHGLLRSVVRATRVSVVAIGISVLAASCTSSDPTTETDFSAESTVQPASAEAEPARAGVSEGPIGNVAEPATAGTADEGSSTTDATGSENAATLKAQAPQLEDGFPAAAQFLSTTTNQRLDQIGEETCSRLPQEPSESAFSDVAVETYNEVLTDGEQTDVTTEDWFAVLGKVTETYCSDRFPFDERIPTASTIEMFRISAPTITTLPEETLDFIEASTDQRIDELRTASCGQVNPQMSFADLESSIQSSYEQLSEQEQSQLSPFGHGELFLALVGFFCFENVPQ